MNQNKKLYVFCYTDPVDAAGLESLFREEGILPVQVGDADRTARGSWDAILTNALHTHGYALGKVPAAGWGARLLPTFEEIAGPLLESLLVSPSDRWYLSGVANVYFVDALRLLGRRMGITTRFVYVHRLGRLRTGDPITWPEFTASLLMARQAGADVLCFDSTDVQDTADTGREAWNAIFGRPSEARLTASAISDQIRLAGAARTEGLPLELKALAAIYAGKRLGAPLVLVHVDQEMTRVEAAADERSALAFWLGQQNRPKPGTHSGFGDELGATVAKADTGAHARLRDAYSKELIALKDIQRSLQAKVRELEAVRGSREAKQQGNEVNRTLKTARQAKPKQGNMTSNKTSAGRLNPSRARRLWRKFRTNPKGYLADSKHRALRMIGEMIWRR